MNTDDLRIEFPLTKLELVIGLSGASIVVLQQLADEKFDDPRQTIAAYIAACAALFDFTPDEFVKESALICESLGIAPADALWERWKNG